MRIRRFHCCLKQESDSQDNNLFTATARKMLRRKQAGCTTPGTRASFFSTMHHLSLIHGDVKALPRPLTTTLSERRRSVGFLGHGSESWACFLVTFEVTDATWHGFFSFRPSHSEHRSDEVRTANIFVEASEAEIHEKARSLGRPLLQGLLDSALHTVQREDNGPTHLRGQFRTLLNANSLEIAGEWTDGDLDVSRDQLERLRSLYESYRIDQVCHLISLIDPEDFGHAVDRILEGERIDFRAKDRVQFARIVVDHIEALLPLPDFDSWAKDFLNHPEAYRLYAHTLHREGRLP